MVLTIWSFGILRPASIIPSTAESTAARFIFMKSVSVLSMSKMTALITFRSQWCLALLRLFLGALDVGGGAGVDLDAVALLDEQRDLDLEAGLERRRLHHVRDGVALDAGHRRGHLEDD